MSRIIHHSVTVRSPSVASIIRLNSRVYRGCTMPMKNPSERRPLWSSTQKFRVRRTVDLCSQFCHAEERGEGVGGGAICTARTSGEWQEGKAWGWQGQERDEKRPRRPGVTKGWIWIWRVAQRGRRGWKDRRLVEQLASRQWHSGWQGPYNLLPRLTAPLVHHPPMDPVCTRMPYSAGKRNRHALPLIRISAGRLRRPLYSCPPFAPFSSLALDTFLRVCMWNFSLSQLIVFSLMDRGM